MLSFRYQSIINGNGDPTQMQPMPDLPVIDDLDLSAKLVTARENSDIKAEVEVGLSEFGD